MEGDDDDDDEVIRVIMRIILTGMFPLSADFALSVKLWPACPPAESPVTPSGMVESVEAIGAAVFFLFSFLVFCFI